MPQILYQVPSLPRGGTGLGILQAGSLKGFLFIIDKPQPPLCMAEVLLIIFKRSNATKILL